MNYSAREASLLLNQEKSVIKVLTYNIHKGFSTTNSRFVLHQIKEAISIIHPHIVFLQEIQGEHVTHESYIENWPKKPQFEFLAEETWPHVAYGKNAIYELGHHGNAILSKFPIIAWENIDVSLQRNASRSLLHGVLKIPDSTMPVHVICIHLGLFKSERHRQLEVLCDRIESHVPHNEPLIIAGDFNDWQSNAQHYLETHLELKEAFKELTGKHARSFPVWSPTLKVDRIYYRGLDAIACKCFSRLPWRRLSDHAPLYAEFTI